MGTPDGAHALGSGVEVDRVALFREKHLLLGWKCEVFWPTDNAYYWGKIVDFRRDLKGHFDEEDASEGSEYAAKKAYFIRYDDGEGEWIEILNGKVEKDHFQITESKNLAQFYDPKKRRFVPSIDYREPNLEKRRAQIQQEEKELKEARGRKPKVALNKLKLKAPAAGTADKETHLDVTDGGPSEKPGANVHPVAPDSAANLVQKAVAKRDASEPPLKRNRPAQPSTAEEEASDAAVRAEKQTSTPLGKIAAPSPGKEVFEPQGLAPRAGIVSHRSSATPPQSRWLSSRGLHLPDVPPESRDASLAALFPDRVGAPAKRDKAVISILADVVDKHYPHAGEEKGQRDCRREGYKQAWKKFRACFEESDEYWEAREREILDDIEKMKKWT